MVVTGSAKVLGVIGHPIEHSLSPVMHNAALRAMGLDFVYVPFDVLPEGLPQAADGIRGLGIVGMNITAPHKEAIIELLDEVSEDALAVGSVNTVSNVGGRLIGSSTDGAGFLKSLVESGFKPAGRSALVIGTGGAGRAVSFALMKAGASIALTDEVEKKAEKLAEDVQAWRGECTGGTVSVLGLKSQSVESAIRDADLLVNCTPVGTYPKTDGIPVPADCIRPGMFVYDLVYNPLKTKLIGAAEAAGARAISGVKMLVYQGALSFRTWIGAEPPIDIMEAAVIERLQR